MWGRGERIPVVVGEAIRVSERKPKFEQAVPEGFEQVAGGSQEHDTFAAGEVGPEVAQDGIGIAVVLVEEAHFAFRVAGLIDLRVAPGDLLDPALGESMVGAGNAKGLGQSLLEVDGSVGVGEGFGFGSGEGQYGLIVIDRDEEVLSGDSPLADDGELEAGEVLALIDHDDRRFAWGSGASCEGEFEEVGEVDQTTALLPVRPGPGEALDSGGPVRRWNQARAQDG
jgi:hypothetical protein